jgi:hypothetical protein
MMTKISRLVFVSALSVALLLSGLGLYAVYATVRERVVETHPLALRRSAESLRNRLDQVGPELERIASDGALRAWADGLSSRSGDSRPEERRPVPIEGLSEALAGSTIFEGLLVLDTQGQVLAAVGSGAGLAGVREQLRPKNSLESELGEVMHTVQFRTELGGIEETSIRIVDPGQVPSLPLASVPLHDLRGQPSASLHGLVRRDELASRLFADLVGDGGSVLLVDASGRIVAAGGELSRGSAEALATRRVEETGAAEPRSILSASRGWVIACAHPAGIYGWTLVAEQPVYQAFRPLVLAAFGFLVEGLALVVLCTLGASWAAGRLVRPLWDLLQGIRDASRGEAVREISTAHAEAESEALIAAFNIMVERQGMKHREVEISHRALREQHEAFQSKYEAVSKLSVTDALTQVPNRRAFETQLQCEIKRLGRSGQGLVLLILDIDDFKQLNDRYGHAAGDEFLQQVARPDPEGNRSRDGSARPLRGRGVRRGGDRNHPRGWRRPRRKDAHGRRRSLVHRRRNHASAEGHGVDRGGRLQGQQDGSVQLRRRRPLSREGGGEELRHGRRRRR